MTPSSSPWLAPNKQSQRKLIEWLVPAMSKKRLMTVLQRGQAAGWLAHRSGPRRASLVRAVGTTQIDTDLITLMLTTLTDLVEAGVRATPEQRRLMMLLARGATPLFGSPAVVTP